eukprot:1159964-Pelagomonas_calceolata.AAC.1
MYRSRSHHTEGEKHYLCAVISVLHGANYFFDPAIPAIPAMPTMPAMPVPLQYLRHHMRALFCNACPLATSAPSHAHAFLQCLCSCNICVNCMLTPLCLNCCMPAILPVPLLQRRRRLHARAYLQCLCRSMPFAACSTSLGGGWVPGGALFLWALVLLPRQHPPTSRGQKA